MFTLSTDDLDLIGKLEAEFDPAVFWADSLVREWIPKSEWEMVCAVERDRLKRVIRWAVVFRDIQRLNEAFGAQESDRGVFRGAFYNIIDEGARGPATKDREDRYHRWVMGFIGDGLMGDPKADACEALHEPSPSDAACKRVLGGFLTYP